MSKKQDLGSISLPKIGVVTSISEPLPPGDDEKKGENGTDDKRSRPIKLIRKKLEELKQRQGDSEMPLAVSSDNKFEVKSTETDSTKQQRIKSEKKMKEEKSKVVDDLFMEFVAKKMKVINKAKTMSSEKMADKKLKAELLPWCENHAANVQVHSSKEEEDHPIILPLARKIADNIKYSNTTITTAKKRSLPHEETPTVFPIAPKVIIQETDDHDDELSPTQIKPHTISNRGEHTAKFPEDSATIVFKRKVVINKNHSTTTADTHKKKLAISVKITDTSAALIQSGEYVRPPSKIKLEDGEISPDTEDSESSLSSDTDDSDDDEDAEEDLQGADNEEEEEGLIKSDSDEEGGEKVEKKKKDKKKRKKKDKKKHKMKKKKTKKHKESSSKKQSKSKSKSKKHTSRSISRSGSVERDRSRSRSRSKSRDEKTEPYRSDSHGRDHIKERHDRKRSSRSRSREKLDRKKHSRSRSRSRSRERYREKHDRKYESRHSSHNRDRDRDHYDRNRERYFRVKDRERRQLREHSPAIKIDKAKLREIAVANAVAAMKGDKFSLKPDQMARLRTGGAQSVNQLTEQCKDIADKELNHQLEYHNSSSEDEVVNKPFDRNDEEDATAFVNHPFAVNVKKSDIIMNIRNAKQLPVFTSAEKVAQSSQLRLTYPVSSGSQHRSKESEWVPVEKKVTDPVTGSAKTVIAVAKQDDKVFEEAPMEAIDIGSVVSERLKAVRKLQDNPYDVQAMGEMHKIQKKMSQWAESKNLPGQFLGSTGATVLSHKELEGNKKNQAWLKKDQFHKAAPVAGGIGKLLLQRMGWSEGQGLGKHNEGSQEPLLLDVKFDRKGLYGSGEAIPGGKKKGSGQQPPAGPPLPRPKDLSGKHPVSSLMELCTKRRWGAPEFIIMFDDGPDHQKNFLFKVKVNGVEYQPTVASNNKKHAKAQTATVCLQAMGLLPR